MPLKPYFSRMRYAPFYQEFRPAYHRIITALTGTTYCKMDIRHKHNISIANKIHNIRHRTTQQRSMISIQSLRMCLIKLHQYRVLLTCIIIFGEKQQTFIFLIFVICPFCHFYSPPIVILLLRIDMSNSHRIRKIRLTPP